MATLTSKFESGEHFWASTAMWIQASFVDCLQDLEQLQQLS